VELDGFEIARFAFLLRAEEDGHLPRYKGSLLRGGFGYTFRSAVCHQRRGDCGECESRDTCAYSYIFETSPDGVNNRFSDYSDIPRPFVVEPDGNQERRFVKGDMLHFGLVLTGKALNYLPYFVFCFDELGRRGLGKGKTRFSLEGVFGLDFELGEWVSLYDKTDRLLREDFPTMSAAKLPFRCSDALSLEFVTPTRVKYRGRYICHLEFHVLIRNLLRRISMMALFHCGFELDCDVKNLIAEAKLIEVRNWNLKWHDWSRYSTRKNARISLGGFMGGVTYEGSFEKFMPFIALGNHIHVGKATTFGLGKYRIDYGRSGLHDYETEVR